MGDWVGLFEATTKSVYEFWLYLPLHRAAPAGRRWQLHMQLMAPVAMARPPHPQYRAVLVAG